MSRSYQRCLPWWDGTAWSCACGTTARLTTDNDAYLHYAALRFTEMADLDP